MNPTSIDVTVADAIPAGTKTDAVALLRQRDMRSPVVTVSIPSAAVTLGSDPKTVSLDLAALAMEDGLTSGTTLADFFLPTTWMAGAADDQVELGDPNGDGVFGATLGGALIKPGKPLLSYLFLRISAPLVTGPSPPRDQRVHTSTVVEQQMPIANFQYWDATNASLALWCWISTMKDDASNADGPIDYAHCDTSAITPITHQTWRGRHVYPRLRGHPEPVVRGALPLHGHQAADHALPGEPRHRLRDAARPPRHRPLREQAPLRDPNDPTQSYLYLKVSEKTPPSGGQMPLSAPLSAGVIADVQTWIAQGANQN